MRWLRLTTRREVQGSLMVADESWRTVLATGSTVGSPASEAVYATNWRDHADELYYTKDPWGWVHFKGSVERTASPAVPAENLLTMPFGYRPYRGTSAVVSGWALPCASTGIAKVLIDYTGVVALSAATSAANAATRIYMDGICYKAEES